MQHYSLALFLTPPRERFAVLLLAFVAFALALLWRDFSAFTTPDTAGYVQYFAMRTWLYPALLAGSKQLFGSYDSIVVLQLAALVAAYVAVALAVQRCYRHAGFALAVMLALLSNPFAFVMAYTGMTDAFFMALLLVFFATVLQLWCQPQPRHFLFLGITLGLALALRPVAYALLPLLFFILWLRWPVVRQRLAVVLLALILPILLLVQVQNYIHQQVHGKNHYETLAISLFGKAAMLGRPAPPAFAAPKFAAQLQHTMAPQLTAVQQETAFFQHFNAYRQLEGWAQYQYPEQQMLAGMQEMGALNRADFMLRVGMAYIAAYPVDYAVNALYHTFGTWLVFSGHTHLLANKIILYAILASGVFCGVLAGTGLARLCRQRHHHHLPTAWQVPFLCAIFMCGYTLLVGLTGLGISRYLCAAWGPLVLATALPLLLLTRFLQAQARRRSAQLNRRVDAAAFFLAVHPSTYRARR